MQLVEYNPVGKSQFWQSSCQVDRQACHDQSIHFAVTLQGQQTENVAAAVQMLAEQNLMPGVRSIALTLPNTFRTERLYTEEVDLLYKKHLALLKVIYTAFRRAPNGGGLRLKVSVT